MIVRRVLSGPAALLAGLVLALPGCSEKADERREAAKAVGERAPLEARPVPARPPLGVTTPDALGYEWGKGRAAFEAATAAHKKKDWVGVKASCQESVAADPAHLAAHRLLASALAQEGAYEEALEHLGVALAGDWVRWGGTVERDPDLELLASSPLGPAFNALNTAYREEFVRRARGGLMVVARRAAFKPPARPRRKNAHPRLASRAEVFAYDVETRRYLRLTQTGFQVLGFVPSPSRDEIAYLTAREVDLAEPPSADPPLLRKLEIGTVSLATPEVTGRSASVPEARAIALEYQAGDELVATTYDATGRWDLGAPRAYTIDRAAAKAVVTKFPPAPAALRLLVRYESVELEVAGEVDGVAADWNPETGGAEEFVIDVSKRRVELPPGQAALRSTMTWSPDRGRLAFATAADACAELPEDRRAALYLVEVETGKLRHIARGATRFSPRFVGGAILAFEDGGGDVRLFDAAVAREVGRLHSRGGIAFHGLGAQAGPACKKDPPGSGVPGAPVGPGPAAPGESAAPTRPAADAAP